MALDSLVEIEFFKYCEQHIAHHCRDHHHHDSNTTTTTTTTAIKKRPKPPKEIKKNFYCFPCSVSYCRYCKPYHQHHQPRLQIYKSSEHDYYVKMSDLQKYVHSSSIKVYDGNKIYLKPKSETKKIKNAEEIKKCDACRKKFVRDEENACCCSLHCKMRDVRKKGKDVQATLIIRTNNPQQPPMHDIKKRARSGKG